MRADAREIDVFAAAQSSPDDAMRSKYRSNAAYASGLVYQAAQQLFDLAGARAVYADSEIGRIFLDIIVATRHVTQNVDINTAEHGRARVNPPRPFSLLRGRFTNTVRKCLRSRPQCQTAARPSRPQISRACRVPRRRLRPEDRMRHLQPAAGRGSRASN